MALRKHFLPEGALEEETFRRYAFASFQINRAQAIYQLRWDLARQTPPHLHLHLIMRIALHFAASRELRRLTAKIRSPLARAQVSNLLSNALISAARRYDRCGDGTCWQSEGDIMNLVDRKELQDLSKIRLKEASALLQLGLFDGAFYLAGYAVECALKSCVIKHLMTTDQFPERKFSEQCWTHNPVQLVALAGLKTGLDADIAADADLSANWETAKDWSEASRYAQTSKAKAEELFQAITDKKHGVFPWLKLRW